MVYELALDLAEEARERAALVKEEALLRLVSRLREARRVFLCAGGEGKHLLMPLARDLTRLGYVCHFVGEPTAPALRRGDMLITLSHLGGESVPLVAARRARSQEGLVAVFTGREGSPLALEGDLLIHIPETPMVTASGLEGKFSPACVFEECCHLILSVLPQMVGPSLNQDPICGRKVYLE